MRLSILSVATVLVLLSGCSSVKEVSLPTSVKEKFTGPTYHTHVVHAAQRQTYDAAKAALKPMDFRFLKGGPAQGVLSAVNRVVGENDMRGSYQLSLDVKLSPVADGTEVAALFSHITEEDFNRRPGMGVTSPIREDGIYENYFQHIEAALAAAAAAPENEK